MKQLVKIRIVRDGEVITYQYWRREFLFIGWWVPFASIACGGSSIPDQIETIAKEFHTIDKPNTLLGKLFILAAPSSVDKMTWMDRIFTN